MGEHGFYMHEIIYLTTNLKKILIGYAVFCGCEFHRLLRTNTSFFLLVSNSGVKMTGCPFEEGNATA